MNKYMDVRSFSSDELKIMDWLIGIPGNLESPTRVTLYTENGKPNDLWVRKCEELTGVNAGAQLIEQLRNRLEKEHFIYGGGFHGHALSIKGQDLLRDGGFALLHQIQLDDDEKERQLNQAIIDSAVAAKDSAASARQSLEHANRANMIALCAVIVSTIISFLIAAYFK